MLDTFLLILGFLLLFVFLSVVAFYLWAFFLYSNLNLFFNNLKVKQRNWVVNGKNVSLDDYLEAIINVDDDELFFDIMDQIHPRWIQHHHEYCRLWVRKEKYERTKELLQPLEEMEFISWSDFQSPIHGDKYKLLELSEQKKLNFEVFYFLEALDNEYEKRKGVSAWSRGKKRYDYLKGNMGSYYRLKLGAYDK